ncbi:MAG: YegS/Rv2252/BmrU family lipid kinase [Clostridia bacterium]|nr:YegS/Rv2252/BmrU family lipid kinase [Clostridia bacterium]
MRKIKLIYNSIAGQSKFKYFLDTIIEQFEKHGFEVSIFRVGKKSNLYEYLKDTDEKTYGIIVAGGDGTLNRVVNVMMQNNINVPLGVIPAGTSNDFAKHIKMPKNFSDCIDRILRGNVQDVDVGCVNDKYFINVCSAGLFSDTSQKVDVALKNIVGKVAYFLAGIKSMINFKPFDVKVETENDIIIEKVSLILIFNGSSVGGMNKFTIGSDIQDGVFDILVIKSKPFWTSVGMFFKIITGTHFKDENVIYLKEPWLKVDKVKGNCEDLDMDGDKGPTFPMEVKCIKGGLKMFL